MCHLQNIAMQDYQESVTTGQTDGQTYIQTDRYTDAETDRHRDGQTDAKQSDPYVRLCFGGDTKTWPK